MGGHIVVSSWLAVGNANGNPAGNTSVRDRKVVLAAVALDGHALHYASAELKADWTLVLAAVTQDGRALRHASAELRADRRPEVGAGGDGAAR